MQELDSLVIKFDRFFSLDPLKVKASLPSDIAHNLLKDLSSQQIFSLEDQFVAIIHSQYENFPENIFWDLEAFLAKLCSFNSIKEQCQFTEKIIKLYKRYGEKNSINFAYIHDFVYGFDWYRWVRKDVNNRKKVKPFDFIFLDYLDKRSLELFELIKKNDSKYPNLEVGVKRNPFGFNRSFSEEIKLHLKLAELDFIPWKAWQFKPRISKSLWDLNLIKERRNFGKKN